jgi:acetylornithine deacetylase/succinyl-diaminopimelate desuccinylase-like protein
MQSATEIRTALDTEITWRGLGEEAVALLQQYLRIDTTNPPGNELAGAEFLAGVLAAEGIPSAIREAAPRRANLVARLRGHGSGEAFILHHHIDVVTANRSRWSFDPFGGDSHDGYLYGRGALDMKSTGILHLVALLAIRRAGISLPFDLIFLATADEESGSELGAKHVVGQYPDWLAGSRFAITELGAVRVEDRYRRPFGSIAVGEKVPTPVRLTARGRAGHASMPSESDPVHQLIRALARLTATSPSPRVLPVVATYFQRLAEALPIEESVGFDHIEQALAKDNFRHRFLRNPFYAAMVGDTLAVTILRGGHKLNVIPGEASADIDCRCLSGSAEELLQRLQTVVGDLPVEVHAIGPLVEGPALSACDTPLYAALARGLERRAPGTLVAPELLVAVTDAATFRRAGIQSYGFSPFVLNNDELARIHGDDERISLENLHEGVRCYSEILLDLAQTWDDTGVRDNK